MVAGTVPLAKPSKYPVKQSIEPLDIGMQITVGPPSHGRERRLTESVGKRGEQMKKGVRVG